jgi:hypothetical protein
VIAEVDPEHTFAVSLQPHQGMTLLTIPAAGLSTPAVVRDVAGRAWRADEGDHR